MVAIQREIQRIGDADVQKTFNALTNTEELKLSTDSDLAKLLAIMLDKQSVWLRVADDSLLISPQEVHMIYNLLSEQPWQLDGFYTSSADTARSITIATIAKLAEFASLGEVLEAVESV